MPPQGNSAWRVTTARVLRRREARGVVWETCALPLGHYARGDNGCTPATGRQQGREHPSVLRFTQSRVVDRMTAAAALGRPMRRFSACWRTACPPTGGHGPGSGPTRAHRMSAETPAAARFTTARQRSVYRHTGKKCCSEQGFREFRQRASPHRPTRARDQCPVRAGRRALHHRPAPHHVQGESTEADSRTDPVRRPRAPPLPERTSQCKRRPWRRGWPIPRTPSAFILPGRSARGADMELTSPRLRAAGLLAGVAAASGSSPRASPAPP